MTVSIEKSRRIHKEAEQIANIMEPRVVYSSKAVQRLLAVQLEIEVNGYEVNRRLSNAVNHKFIKRLPNESGMKGSARFVRC